MDRLDKIISDIGYVLDCLRTLRNICEAGNCNDCQAGRYGRCAYKPKVGQMVRYNCPFYSRVWEDQHGVKDRKTE